MNIYILYTLTGQVMWGLLPLFWMLLQDVPSMYILATRIVWSALFCYGLILQKHLVPELKNVLHDRQEWPYIFGACIMITTNWGCFIYAMTHNHILQASLAYFINPIVVILFGAIIFHEHLGACSNDFPSSLPLPALALLFSCSGKFLTYRCAFVYHGRPTVC